MTMYSKVGNFTIDTSKTSGQTTPITGLGFQPKIVLFFWGGRTTAGEGVTAANIMSGFGAANGTTFLP